jgi:hypothetical protein
VKKPLSFEDCAALLGARDGDSRLVAMKLKLTETEAVEGEPDTTFLKNGKLGLIFELEEGVVVSFSLDAVSGAALPDGAAFGMARAALANAWGKPADAARRHDTFRRGELRVECTFIKDVLEEIRVERWERQRL